MDIDKSTLLIDIQRLNQSLQNIKTKTDLINTINKLIELHHIKDKEYKEAFTTEGQHPLLKENDDILSFLISKNYYYNFFENINSNQLMKILYSNNKNYNDYSTSAFEEFIEISNNPSYSLNDVFNKNLNNNINDILLFSLINYSQKTLKIENKIELLNYLPKNFIEYNIKNNTFIKEIVNIINKQSTIKNNFNNTYSLLKKEYVKKSKNYNTYNIEDIEGYDNELKDDKIISITETDDKYRYINILRNKLSGNTSSFLNNQNFLFNIIKKLYPDKNLYEDNLNKVSYVNFYLNYPNVFINKDKNIDFIFKMYCHSTLAEYNDENLLGIINLEKNIFLHKEYLALYSVRVEQTIINKKLFLRKNYNNFNNYSFSSYINNLLIYKNDKNFIKKCIGDPKVFLKKLIEYPDLNLDQKLFKQFVEMAFDSKKEEIALFYNDALNNKNINKRFKTLIKIENNSFFKIFYNIINKKYIKNNNVELLEYYNNRILNKKNEIEDEYLNNNLNIKSMNLFNEIKTEINNFNFNNVDSLLKALYNEDILNINKKFEKIYYIVDDSQKSEIENVYRNNFLNLVKLYYIYNDIDNENNLKENLDNSKNSILNYLNEVNNNILKNTLKEEKINNTFLKMSK